MKKISLTIIFLLAFTFAASAATLTDALKITFQNNLELKAERKNLEVQREVLTISKSDFFPTLTLSGTKNFENTNKLTNQSGADASITDTDTMTTSVKLEQTLIDGSARSTKYEKSKLGLNLSEAKLIKKEQDVFMKAIEAYTGLILAYEKLNINQENVNLLQRQFEIDNARLSRAQITATDLAQSQSSLSGAQAGFIGAQNNIITSKLAYENIKPFELLFLELGSEILKNLDGFLAVNPTQAVQKIKRELKSAISSLRTSKDIKQISLLKKNLNNINAIGGTSSIVPSEGLVFKYNGKMYKFTGAFAPVNQILGSFKFAR